MFVSVDRNKYITAVSDRAFQIDGQTTRFIKGRPDKRLVGQRFPGGKTGKSEDFVPKPTSELKVAVICNWQTKCGISTYSKYLVDAIKPKIKEIRIFSENSDLTTAPDGPEVERCWKRGECMVPLVKKVLAWKPDFVIVQHEYGIFPNAFYFMQMCQLLENVPYVVTLHSVYEHLDKIVYSACIKNIVVHTPQGKDILVKHGNTNNIVVIPHGCVKFDDVQELWNICQNPYTIMQFGFGFAYKGVERALDAIALLKNSDKKFENIFYFYLLSDNEHTSRIHVEYYKKLLEKIEALGLQHNVAIVRKYQTDHMLNLYLRLAKLAIFPYINNPNNTVYAASGAIRVAMANKIPVLASESHLFDDLEGVVPRPDSVEALAKSIDEVFSNGMHRNGLVAKNLAFLEINSWDQVASKYLSLHDSILATI